VRIDEPAPIGSPIASAAPQPVRGVAFGEIGLTGAPPGIAGEHRL
jgi:hypothetical protein